MCLIVAKEKNVDFDINFVADCLINSSHRNKDGFGYAIKRENANNIFLSKNQDSVEDLIEELKTLEVQKNDELIIHLRNSSTPLSNVSINCQPFIVSSKEEDIDTLEGYTDYPVLAHNGFIDSNSLKYKKESDTYLFCKNILSVKPVNESKDHISRTERHIAIFKTLYDYVRLEYINRDALNYFMGYGYNDKLEYCKNKFAILRTGDLPLLKIGSFISKNNLFFSNDSFIEVLENAGIV